MLVRYHVPVFAFEVFEGNTPVNIAKTRGLNSAVQCAVQMLKTAG